MQKFAASITAVRFFVLCLILTMASLRQSGSHYCCMAWMARDGIASNCHNRQVQLLKRHRNFHQDNKLFNQLRSLNIQSAYIDRLGPFKASRRHLTVLPMSPTSTSTTAVIPARSDDPSDPLKNEINQRIYSVASTMCNLSADQISITWKSKRIVVTVHTDNAFLDASTSEGNDNDDGEIEIDFIDEEDFLDDDDEANMMKDHDDMDDGDFLVEASSSESASSLSVATAASMSKNDVLDIETTVSTTASDGVDMTLLARSINAALDDGEDGIGTQITQQYEIEVSTPGITSDDITTPRMFAAYRGFDVIVHYLDPKKKVLKQHEGRLVEKNEEHVIINQKGRMKHFKNMHVQAVKLPKFKKEKGSR